MTRWFHDTLFKRLFLLMWAALVGSHLLAFSVVHSVETRHGPGGPGALPTLGSLPPGGGMPGLRPPPGPPPQGGTRGPPPPPHGEGEGEGTSEGLSTELLWLDYGIRFLAMGVAAWFGARWLTEPVRRLGEASRTLAPAIAAHQPLPALDERSGTLEVRQAAQVFNAMARQLHTQFGAQSLLLAAVSHDLRTPLARLRLRLEAMPHSDKCIDDLREMDALIGGVLAMIRDRHAGAPAQRLDLPSLLQSLVDDLAEQGHAIRLLAPLPEAARVRARPAAVARVLGNLFGNALHHGAAVQAVEVRIEPAGDVWQVHVDDHGPGIAADRLGAVFQPFYRADSSGQRRDGGVGLGLYIARDLAEREGGAVGLSNRAGEGLRATLSLPRAA